jgi:hypothetical protein
MHAGRPSSLAIIEEEFLSWIFENRELGIAISVRMVAMKAAELDRSFRRRTNRFDPWLLFHLADLFIMYLSSARDQVVRRFLKAHDLSIRVGTHVAQRPPEETRAEAKAFIDSMIPRLSTKDRSMAFILNMDQTPNFFCMTPKPPL